MDENSVKHLKTGDFDILVVYDYSDLNFEADIKNYAEITLIAWSMGVLTASILNLEVQKSIAINGTQKPVDAKFGINPKIYDLTLNNFSQSVKDKFFANMFFDENEYKKFHKPLRTLENQRLELSVLKKSALKNKNCDFKFDCAIISNQDKIIPAKNQINFWQTKKVKVVELNSGHYPFFEFDSFKEILNETL